MAWLRREWQAMLLALQFLTRLPLPASGGVEPALMRRAVRHFPLAGALVGAFGAAIAVGASLLWPPLVAAALAVAAAVWLTAAFHEDGLADTFDALLGAAPRERALAVMKDSRIGSFGAIALVLMLLGKFVALIELDALLVAPALIAGHAFSRLCSTLLLHCLDYAREEGKAKPLATRITLGELACATVFGCAALFLLPPAAMACGVALALGATAVLAAQIHKRLGGYTGDCLGATQQVAELAFYAGLLCRFT